jgi:hypothetical protein
MALATLTVKVEGNPYMDGSIDPFRVICDWKSTDGGAVSKAICSTYAAQKEYGNFGPLPTKIRGILRQAQTSPGLLGVPATEPPTAAYDITILDALGLDVMAGKLADRSATASEIVASGDVYIDSELTLTIASAGNETHGRIILTFDPMEP